jgi:hypothetical protein
MDLREATRKILSSFQGHGKLATDFDVECNYADTVNEIRLKAVKQGDKNFHVLVLETLNEKELFGDDSKGGEK